MKTYDLVIVGAGILGLSSAFQIIKSFPNLKIALLEKESGVAFHQTGHNSGVIHSGIYYKAGSNKAKNCKEGRELLIEFAKENDIPFDICGKIIVASQADEIPLLYDIFEKGMNNEIQGIKFIKKQEIKELEPYCDAIEGIHVPTAGIIDYKLICLKLKENLEKKGVDLFFEQEVNSIVEKQEITIKTNKEVFVSKYVITCGGLYSDRLCLLNKIKPEYKILGFRGDYYQLKKESKHLLKNLIYPVPDPEFPFLGVHLTRMINGDVECGPNAVFSFKREGYEKTDFSLKDSFDALGYLGTWRLFAKHWKYGLEEYRRAFSKTLFLKSLQRLVPDIQMSDIEPAKAGVRAVALSKKGIILDDFQFETTKKMIHVINAPSPAATACLAIGNSIKNKLAEMI